MLDLIKKEVAWICDEPQNKAFSELKLFLMKSPVLFFMPPSKPTQGGADTSSFGLSTMFYQEVERERKPIVCIFMSTE